jgi:hypothetical protein
MLPQLFASGRNSLENNFMVGSPILNRTSFADDQVYSYKQELIYK